MPAARFALPDTRPAAPAASVLAGDHWRITVLLDGLLRLEWSPDGGFEDRASTFAVHRDLPTPEFEVNRSDSRLEIVTERLHLTWDLQPFSAAGLTVQVRGRVTDHRSTWRWGTTPETLGGTGRTLDGADGAIPLEPGVVSRDGIAVVDDSASFLFTEDGWIGTRVQDRADVYVFAYGHDYPAAIRALYAVSGAQPVLPRWALGNWWSRYHAYSADEYLELMDRFAAEGVPFSVGVLDMDWHRVASVPERYGTGWTGYTWEPTLFPDPEGFLRELHRRGLRVTLNVHPHEGVQPFEDAYPDMCKAMGVDPAADLGVPFDIADEGFAEAYFDVLHHPLEAQGVDFWWVDWQQGHLSSVPGVDPLWMLNHLHFLDSGRDGRRGLTFSRFAGPGSHRYPVGFSGDTFITWDSLRFQPEFTATAANIGYGWWSHDVGGHVFGERDDRLTTRWMQLGVFSPINRLHSSSNPFLQKEPWAYPRQARDVIGEALRFRHRLVPYLHSMNHRAAHGDPLVRPMYHDHPELPVAYDVPRQFLFGDSLLVAPITDPDDPVTLMGATRAWLPEGTWGDIATGVVYRARSGGEQLTLHRDERSIPALLRAGAVLPLTRSADTRTDTNPDALELLLLPGADGHRELVEDDGTGTTVRDIPTSRTALTWDDAADVLTIGPASNPAVVPARRSWTVTFLGLSALDSVSVVGGGSGAVIERTGLGWQVTVEDVPSDAELRLTVRATRRSATADRTRRLHAVLSTAQWDHELKWRAWGALESSADEVGKLAELQAIGVPPGLLSALSEILVSS
ncbi:TIM-barrel domain-containing protein [Pseudonocardia sp. CA-107938]|uniref:glycoside hydrolase family 31 protein n=1 Tax=Pseudonocardia sp. CA-107938 TaxID=3240021 RepID=UPI003D8F0314